MTDADTRPRDAVPELLPDREELARAEIAAYWMATGRRGPDDGAPLRIELCTRALRLPSVNHEAAVGHRLRIQLRSSTRTIAVTEEPDTRSHFVWDTFAPSDFVSTADGDTRAIGSGPTGECSIEAATEPTRTVPSTRGIDTASLTGIADRLRLAERVLRETVEVLFFGLPEGQSARFLDYLCALPRLLDALACWDAFYGRARRDFEAIGSAATVLGMQAAEMALVAVVGGLAQWCEESVLRCAVSRIAVPAAVIFGGES
jgi:hypothetical protein